MREMSTKLNRRQQIAAEMLGFGHRPSQVAEALGSSRETISRWQRQAHFAKAVQAAQTELLKTIIQDRRHLLDKSHQTLMEAFGSAELLLQTKANLALRFLSVAGGSSNIYSFTERIIDAGAAQADESNQAFMKIMGVLDKLAELKAAGQNLNDLDYRTKAQETLNF
jgi:ParB-like chromosome segregation protein Spo0J